MASRRRARARWEGNCILPGTAEWPPALQPWPTVSLSWQFPLCAASSNQAGLSHLTRLLTWLALVADWAESLLDSPSPGNAGFPFAEGRFQLRWRVMVCECRERGRRKFPARRTRRRLAFAAPLDGMATLMDGSARGCGGLAPQKVARGQLRRRFPGT